MYLNKNSRSKVCKIVIPSANEHIFFLDTDHHRAHGELLLSGIEYAVV